MGDKEKKMKRSEFLGSLLCLPTIGLGAAKRSGTPSKTDGVVDSIVITDEERNAILMAFLAIKTYGSSVALNDHTVYCDEIVNKLIKSGIEMGEPLSAKKNKTLTEELYRESNRFFKYLDDMGDVLKPKLGTQLQRFSLECKKIPFKRG